VRRRAEEDHFPKYERADSARSGALPAVLPALLTPVIIVGGSRRLVHADRSRRVRVVYALLISLFFYRTLTLRDSPTSSKET
jgi:TRAP-type C4-dicarboxylate transport system permease large subunit